MPKASASTGSSHQPVGTRLQYPPGCKEIQEELPTDDLIRR